MTERDASLARPVGRDERLAQASERLAEAVGAITTGEDWAAMLRVASRLHRYSASNIFLIALACPEATMVGGYQTWKVLGRHVRAGEKAIPILAPVLRRGSLTNRGHDRIDPEGDIPGPVLVGFRVAHVFDVSQTDGEPLPDVAPRLLEGRGPAGAFEAVAAHVRQAGFKVERGPLAPANGQTDYRSATVTVADRLSDAAALKTLCHEAGHAILHGPKAPVGLTRSQAEVEAESVAFVVCAELGVAADDYSFAYAAHWSGGDPDVVRKAAERALGAARRILDAIAPATPDPGAAARAVLARPVPSVDLSPAAPSRAASASPARSGRGR